MLFLWETHVKLENPQNYEILGCTIHFYPSLVTLAMDCWIYMGFHCRILYKTDQSVALIDMVRFCIDPACVNHVEFIPSAVTCTKHVFRWYKLGQGYGLAIEG